MGAVKKKCYVDVYNGTFTAWYAMADMDGSLMIITMNGASKTAKHYLVEGKKIVDTVQILCQDMQYSTVNTDTTDDILSAQEFITATNTAIY